jgi:hypothetical protein
MMKNTLDTPKVLKLTRSKRIPKVKAKTNNQFALDKAIKTSRIKKTKGIVVRLASKMKAMDKRKNAKNFINY